MPGFTRIPNDDVFDNSLWTADKFTKGQAFIDLYRLAQFKEGIVHKRGIFIQLKPGQIGWSIVEFGKRWKWSIGKVKRFLKYLKKVGQIELQNTNVSTTITLLHWINNDTANSTANGKQTVLQTESKRYPYNIDKIDKIDNTYDSSIEFDSFWNLYDKKINRSKCEMKWRKLKLKEKEIIMNMLPDYILSTPDIQYRKNPLTYLNNKGWNDSIIVRKSKVRSNMERIMTMELP